MSITEKLKAKARQVKQQPQRSTEPVWAGPQDASDRGGITQSLIAKYLVCKERFRLLTMEGLKVREGFSHRLEYGNMWHVCEEAHAAKIRGDDDWIEDLKSYVTQLCRKYPMNQDEIVHWWKVCQIQFPLYVKHWAEHPDVKDRTPLLAEQIFNVPYQLPSGRTAYLRGKWDSVDLVGKGKDARIWLMENKSKGDIDVEQLKRQLTFDLQTMLYSIALTQDTGVEELERAKIGTGKALLGKNAMPHECSLASFAGVRYNVIRRPLSGGTGTIKRHEATKNKPAETEEAYYSRVRGVIDGTGLDSKKNPYPGPSHFFVRWNVPLTADDISRFRRETLDSVLENLLDDYEWWKSCFHNYREMTIAGKPAKAWDVWDMRLRQNQFPRHAQRHFRLPFGVSSPLLDGGMSPIDHYLESGSEVGLERTNELFPELKPIT